jgi:peptidoglycan/LPS O-acetylase OafA/YrhL
MLPSRVFEFLLGSILVIFKINNKSKFNLKRINSFYGLTIIVLSYVFFNDYTTTPSFWTLIPLLGGVIIIIDENQNTFNRVLQNKHIVFIGLISYSLYLWHYPVITFLDYYYIKKNLFYYFYFTFLLVIFLY